MINLSKDFPKQIFAKEMLVQRLENDEEFIKEIIEIFIEDLQSQIVQLEQAIQEHDPEQVNRIGHTIKGASKNIGADAISQIAFEIESAGKSQKLNGISDSFNKLTQSFEEFKACFI